MFTCLPFLVGLILYSGAIILNLFDLIYRKTSSGNCDDVQMDQIKTKTNIYNMIVGVTLISVVYLLCKYKHEKIAWAVILTPVVLSLILFIAILYKIKSLTSQDMTQ